MRRERDARTHAGNLLRLRPEWDPGTARVVHEHMNHAVLAQVLPDALFQLGAIVQVSRQHLDRRRAFPPQLPGKLLEDRCAARQKRQGMSASRQRDRGRPPDSHAGPADQRVVSSWRHVLLAFPLAPSTGAASSQRGSNSAWAGLETPRLSLDLGRFRLQPFRKPLASALDSWYSLLALIGLYFASLRSQVGRGTLF